MLGIELYSQLPVLRSRGWCHRFERSKIEHFLTTSFHYIRMHQCEYTRKITLSLIFFCTVCSRVSFLLMFCRHIETSMKTLTFCRSPNGESINVTAIQINMIKHHTCYHNYYYSYFHLFSLFPFFFSHFTAVLSRKKVWFACCVERQDKSINSSPNGCGGPMYRQLKCPTFSNEAFFVYVVRVFRVQVQLTQVQLLFRGRTTVQDWMRHYVCIPPLAYDWDQ